MDKELARRLLPVINSPEVAAALNDYASAMIAHYSKQLVGERDVIQMRRLQGQIKELQALLGLRDTVIAKSKEAK